MARQYYKDSTTGQMKPIGVKVEDTLPVGTIVEYTGSTIPEGWVDIGSGKIEKQYQVIPTNAKLENGDSVSDKNGYVAEYINDHSVVVSAVEPTGSARKKVWLQHSKNILDCRSLETTTISGVTFTPVYDSNGALLYINVNGTATSNCVYHISSQKKFNGSYILSGVSNGSTSSYYIDFGNYVYITNEEATFNMSSSNNYDPIITVINGTTLNNVKFYPMLRVSTNIDNTYEPYSEGDRTFILNNNVYEEFKPNSGVVLWKNSNPNNVFDSQTITLNDSLLNYKYYEIIYNRTNGDYSLSSGKIPTNRNAMLSVFRSYGFIRGVNIATNTTLTIGEATKYNSYGGTSTSVDNNYCIPEQILGYK